MHCCEYEELGAMAGREKESGKKERERERVKSVICVLVSFFEIKESHFFSLPQLVPLLRKKHQVRSEILFDKTSSTSSTSVVCGRDRRRTDAAAEATAAARAADTTGDCCFARSFFFSAAFFSFFFFLARSECDRAASSPVIFFPRPLFRLER